MADTIQRSQRGSELQVLSVGLLKTGSSSIAEALTILGYKNVHHGLNALDDREFWSAMHRATNATFPNLPTYTGNPFTRSQWDDMYGSCDAATDLTSFFAPELIKAYPEAKVILVIRDFDEWLKSYNNVFADLFSFRASLLVYVAEPMIGYEIVKAMRNAVRGFFRGRNEEECRRNSREAFHRHNKMVQDMVSPDNLLVYRIGEGWEPICRFLDKPVPNVEFPWVNEAVVFRKRCRRRGWAHLFLLIKVLIFWVLALASVGFFIWVVDTTRREYLSQPKIIAARE